MKGVLDAQGQLTPATRAELQRILKERPDLLGRFLRDVGPLVRRATR